MAELIVEPTVELHRGRPAQSAAAAIDPKANDLAADGNSRDRSGRSSASGTGLEWPSPLGSAAPSAG